jgi:peptidyl-prolyl cis-trans isomerase SurA
MPRRSLIAGVLVLLGATACAQTFAAGAAVVNGVSISIVDLERQIDAGAGEAPEGALTGEARIARARDILIALIQGELIRQEGEARAITVGEDEIEGQIAQIRGAQSEEEFAARVAQAGFTNESLRGQVAIQVTAQKLQAELAPEVGDDELREVYDLSRQQFQQAKIKHILFSVPEGQSGDRQERQARSARVEIQGGSRFEAIARQRSDDPGSAPDGGRLPGWTTLQSLDPSFAQGVLDADINRVTEPVRSQFGWHLILVLERRTEPFAQVRAQLQQQLQQQASDSAFQEFLFEVMESADIDVNPRYGEWDPETGAIVAHEAFTPAEPETDPLAPPEPPFTLPGG